MVLPGTTRLAPSPTGALHLGNARTFLATWAIARQRGWRVMMRIDDLEGPRIKPGADRQAIDDLLWLGLTWDDNILYQSNRLAAYEAALSKLSADGHLYPCVCTRAEIEARALAIEADGGVFYPGTCRGRFASPAEAFHETGRPSSLRFHVEEGEHCFDDEFLGDQSFLAGIDFGDFVVRKADGEHGYHLATVVDDADAGVTHVMRGKDLLISTPRQLLLYEALGLSAQKPGYIHLPLVVGGDGRKLGKRHGDTRLRQLREDGVTAGQVRAMLARWSGIDTSAVEISAEEWIERFDLARLSSEPVVYDDARQRLTPWQNGKR